MSRKRRRLLVVVAGLALLGSATALALSALRDSLVFFYSPTELAAGTAQPDRRLRVGGLVLEGSVRTEDDGVTRRFAITDLRTAVPVVYAGILPDLFREGQGVVAEGRLGADGVFRADGVLAKHDETYMPPEVAEALKKSGRWQGAP